MNDLERALCGEVGTYDGSKVEWSECRCGGRVGLEGRVVLHSQPPCPSFLALCDQYGVLLQTFRDVHAN